MQGEYQSLLRSYSIVHKAACTTNTALDDFMTCRTLGGHEEAIVAVEEAVRRSNALLLAKEGHTGLL